MRKKGAFALLLVALCGVAVAWQNSGAKMGGIKLGDRMPEAKLVDLNGRARSLGSLRGKNGTLLLFIATRCPVSNAYNARMAKIAEEYGARGIAVVGINSNVTEPADEVKRHATEHNLKFTILKDDGNKLADMLGAQVTPEAFLFDASGKLVYHGRIDNAQDEAKVQSHDLRDAIEAVLAGRPVAKAEARAFGCSIKRAS
ncbi:MAG: thioredoxin family protein [Pyrinomonas sp.]|uniref:thioredoxin family protein n=1 Tax=Pyrinomonas sp. TaxID=2080306 RepID=UPI00332E9FC5